MHNFHLLQQTSFPSYDLIVEIKYIAGITYIALNTHFNDDFDHAVPKLLSFALQQPKFGCCEFVPDPNDP